MATKPAEDALYSGVPGNEDEAAKLTEQENAQRLQDAMATAMNRLQKNADERVRRRANIETRWLEDMRAFMGYYDTDTEKNLQENRNRSKALINMIRAKTNAWDARLGDLLFPADDKNYGIAPTPVPELTAEADNWEKEIAKAEAAAQQATDEYNRQAASQASAQAQGQQGDPPDQGLLDGAHSAGQYAMAAKQKLAEARATMEVAEKCCEAMSKTIDDQLVECNYAKRCRDVISDACRLGAGILKGPLFSQKAPQRWQRVKGPDGQTSNVFELQPAASEKPEFMRVDPWSFFPDDNARSIEESESEFERHMPNRSQLRKMARELGFYPDAVRELLLDKTTSFVSDTNLSYLTELRDITGEGEAVRDRYIVWEYHGPLEVEEIADLLEAVGQADDANKFREENDPLDEIRVILYFCQGKLLKISPEYVLDSGESLYSVFTFEKSESSILGAIGVPRIMRDAWRALNAAWRMMLDNGALSAGPQIVIDKKKIAPENGSWKLEPMKVWDWISDDLTDKQENPFQVFNITMNQPQIAGIIELALKFIDEETALPIIAQGDQGEHITNTVGGMSILANAANVILRRVVKNWDDDLTTPSVRRLYDWNMQFSDKDEIKGDMKVDARGTSALLVREIQSQQYLNIAYNWSTHPVLSLMLKEYEAAKLALQSLSINSDDLLRDSDSYDQRKKDASDAQQQSPDQVKAAASIQVAQIDAASREKTAQTNLEIAQLRDRTAQMELAQTGQISIAQLQALMQGKQIDVASKERMKAVEVAVEDQRAQEAVAHGEPPADGTGKGIG